MPMLLLVCRAFPVTRAFGNVVCADSAFVFPVAAYGSCFELLILPIDPHPAFIASVHDDGTGFFVGNGVGGEQSIAVAAGQFKRWLCAALPSWPARPFLQVLLPLES